VTAAAAALALEHVTVRYPGSAMPQLDDVSLALHAGEVVAIVGPNGAGKTTALRALLGIAPLASGRASILGRDVAAWDRRALAREVAVVGQREEPAFPITVAELAAMGRYPHLGPWRAPDAADREAVQRALVRADVAHLADRWVQTLSGGEWQRVRLARALAQEPHVLVLDEPTSSLDLRHEMQLFEIVEGLGITALIVSHHVNTAARFASRMVLMSAGRIVADDKPADVLTADRLSSVFAWPVAVHRLPDGSTQLYPQRSSPAGDGT
jgi:iron complex transport system ATP-binding protein